MRDKQSTQEQHNGVEASATTSDEASIQPVKACFAHAAPPIRASNQLLQDGGKTYPADDTVPMLVRWPLSLWLGGMGRILLKNSSQDRKSTRLNSSHQKISYAVFCLKKKKKKID